MQRVVERGLSRKTKRIPFHIGVDEKSFARGHKYETLVYDLQESTVEYVGEDRTQESLSRYYEQFSEEERESVKVIAMDMWDPYIAATREAIPGAEDKIVFDKFHIMRQMTDAVDKVRKQEHQELMKDDRDVLKGTKYLWLWSKREYAGTSARGVSVVEEIRPQGRACLVNKGELEKFMELLQNGLGREIFKEVVLLGNTFAP